MTINENESDPLAAEAQESVPAAPAHHPDIAALVEQHFGDLVTASGGIARELSTEAYNRVHTAKDALKRDLTALLARLGVE